MSEIVKRLNLKCAEAVQVSRSPSDLLQPVVTLWAGPLSGLGGHRGVGAGATGHPRSYPSEGHLSLKFTEPRQS